MRGTGAAMGAWVATLLSCATAGSPLERAARAAQARDAPAADLAAAGFHAWLYQSDARTAGARFAEAVRRDPRNPWARLGAAWAAERLLDDATEVEHLLALVDGAPGHPLAPVALRRLADLADGAPLASRAVEAGLGPLLSSGRLRGMAAHRARVTRAAAAEARGDLELAERVRVELGTVTTWTLVGPCGAYHALDMERPFPPEAGQLRCERPFGVAKVEPRMMAFPEGFANLDGEPAPGDITYLVADVRFARGGEYLVSVGSSVAVQVLLDSEPLAERRAFTAFPPGAQLVRRQLTAGIHRLTVKLGRGANRASVAVSFAREDGEPSDAVASPATSDRELSPRRPLRFPPLASDPREAAQALALEVGPVLARLVVARDQMANDREAAKALLDEASAMLPDAPPILAAIGHARLDDPTLADRVARARGESAFERALARDPEDAETRLARAELMRAGERLDDAEALMAGLAEPAAAQPRALVLRARIAWARGFGERAEGLASEAQRRGGSCQALDLLYELVSRRDAIARRDEIAQALASCPRGRERLAEHHRVRGDAAGAAAALEPVVQRSPARIEPRLALARALVARGDPQAAARELEALARFWPRDARLEKRRAEALELAGDAVGARSALERALALDGSDLSLRRALALGGSEVLSEYAQDGQKAIRAYQAKGDRPQSSSAFVLDAGAVFGNLDGSATERIHQVIQVLDQRGVDRWGEMTLPPGAQPLRLRTLKADGRILEPEEIGARHSSSLPGLEAGDFVEIEYLHATPPRGPVLPGFATDPFYFRVEGSPLFRSTYLVAAPAGMGLEADAHNMERPRVTREGDRDVLRVVREEVPPLVDEPADASIAEYLPFVQAGAGGSPEALPLALGDAVVERTRPTGEIAALARTIARADSGTLAGEPLLRAAYDRVNALVEGQGGSWTESASQILSRGRGSRTILLKAVCEALGLRARVVLVRVFGTDPAPYRFPRPDLYAMAVLRVEDGGRTWWLDPTTRYTPFGLLPESARGAEALVLPEPGERPEMVRTPTGGAGGRELDLAVSLEPNGDALIDGVERYLGFEGAVAKAAVERLDPQMRQQSVEQALARSLRGLALERLEVEGERRADEPLVLRWRARVPQLARLEEGRAVIEARLFPVRVGSRYATLASRETPLLVGATEQFRMRLTLLLPPGLHAAAAPREVVGPFGSYQRLEWEEPGKLIREDRFTLPRARIAPADYPAFGRFAKAVDEAQESPMHLVR